MKEYKNVHGSSSVLAYEYGNDWIQVKFESGTTCKYTYKNSGRFNVEAMKQCADNGKGLSSYIYNSNKNNALYQWLLVKMDGDSTRFSRLCKWAIVRMSWFSRLFVASSLKKYDDYTDIPMKKSLVFHINFDLLGNGGVLGRHKLVHENNFSKMRNRGAVAMSHSSTNGVTPNGCVLSKCLEDMSGVNNTCCVGRLLLNALKNVNLSEASVQ
jgi:hypothetical protein